MTNICDWIYEGDKAYQRGDLATAESYFRQVVTARPNYADVRNRLGVVLTILGRREEAVEQFIAALRINPRYVEARVNLAVTYQELGLAEEAKREFLQIWQIDPGNPIARKALGFIWEVTQ